MLGYRSSFAIDVAADPTADADTCVDLVLREGRQWLRTAKEEPGAENVEDGQCATLPSGCEVAFLHDRSGETIEYGRMLVMDPPLLSGERWTTSLLVAVDHDERRALPEVVLEVDAPVDPARAGRTPWTSRPRLVQQILGAFTCVDGGLRLSDAPWSLPDEDVQLLIDRMTSRAHHALVILCAQDASIPPEIWRQRLDQITGETVGQAATYVLSPAAMRMFNAHVSARHRLSPYSPRTFRPPVDFDDPDDGVRHRILSARAMWNSTEAGLRRMLGWGARDFANGVPVGRTLRRLDAVSGAWLDQIRAERRRAYAVSAEQEQHPAHATLEDAGGEVDGRADVEASQVSARSSVPTNAADLRARLVELEREVVALRARHDQDQAELRDLRVQAQEARDLLQKQRIEVAERLEDQAAALRGRLEEEQIAAAEVSGELRAERTRTRTLGYRLAQARQALRGAGQDEKPTWSEPHDAEHPDYPAAVDSWEDLELQAAETFEHLYFACDWKNAEELAHSDPLGRWAQTTWDSLCMLNDYARAKTRDHDRFAANLRTFLSGGAPAGSHVIPAGRLRGESETVRNNRDWMRERTVDVPASIDPDGQIAMRAHIAIQTNGRLSPRLYFADCTAKAGKVVVGYIGAHPTNTKTS